MKPKTKMHVKVLGLSEQLIKIDYEMLKWAAVECLEHKGYMTKSRVICLECGERFSPELVSRKRAVCPHCQSKIKVEESKCSTMKQHIYVAKAIVFDEFQVIRNFEIFSYHKSGKKVKYYISEILQHWILPDGRREVVAQNHTINNYCNSWNGGMEIRDKKPNWQGEKYDVYPFKIHPDSTFKNEYKKIGISHDLKGLTILNAIKYIPISPKVETLVKCKQYMLAYHFKNGCINQDVWSAIKICIRNKYMVEDATIWIDYIELLRYFNKDLHNAFYVCPKNLKQVHDKLVAKRREIQKRRSIERQREEIKEDQKSYKKEKQKFFGLQFTEGNITVKVLEHVKEFMEEGDALHHCVFTNKYYKKANSLVMSAKIGSKSIETVEVSLTDLRIIQSRGKSNLATEYHNQIVSIVENNLQAIGNLISH